MAENTKIEWADHTFNPWIGCTKISPACDHCYAEGWARRYRRDAWGQGKARLRTSEHTWKQPLKWNAEAERTGMRPRVFCASLADVFDNAVDPKWMCDLWDLIRATPQLDWLLLTKRIGNAKNMIGAHMKCLWPPNVWLGITVVNQAEADRDIPKLLAVPAAKRFLSIEPMLGAIDITAACAKHRWTDQDGVERVSLPRELDWIILGGETGPGSRPMHPDWVRSLRDQCQVARVPFFFKQWGDHVEWDGSQSPSPSTRLDDLTPMVRVGKKAAGRLLDGREWNEVPE
ncbi:hypothetical protein CO615_04690 [Lysobacteraceae bacterium NML75-0749]|nr:hypothetical protein CO615_04690 [Xanthomonadaceae bacterium NML75-0749]